MNGYQTSALHEAKRRLRHTMREILCCLALSCILFISILTHVGDHDAAWAQAIAGILIGVPAGFLLWCVYRVLRFAL